MSAVFDDLLRLLSHGWAPYHGRVEGRVYEGLGCTRSAKARWMVREGRYICLGCGKRCSLVDPAGFELLLPIPSQAKRLAFAVLPAVSAEELIAKKLLLTIPEVEFCLNISRRQVYDLMDEGRLSRHPDPPIRITTASVRLEAARRKP